MNLKDLHTQEKEVSAVALFKGETGTTSAMHLVKNGLLKEHVTKIPALLICVSGEVIFENEKSIKETLLSGDYIAIEADVKHWLVANEDSQLLLLK
jgi:quercetin dioxygenase-like cupin family protein